MEIIHSSVQTPPWTVGMTEGPKKLIRFDHDGLVPVVTVDHDTSDVIMVAYMTEATLRRSIALREAVYWNRGRKAEWHKGAVRGRPHYIHEIRVDSANNCLVLLVDREPNRMYSAENLPAINIGDLVSAPNLRTLKLS